MILQALIKRYDDSGGTRPGWQTRPVDFAINIDRGGNIIDIIDVRNREGKKRERRLMLLPAEPAGRTSGIKAAFLCDNDGYLLGNDEKRGADKFKAAALMHNNVLEQVNTEAASAIKAFFSGSPRGAELPRENDKDTGANCVFMLEGRFITEFPELGGAWDEYDRAERAQGEQILDLVSGERGAIEALHDSVSLPGVTMGRVPLISINAESFSSYGSTMKDPAARISKRSAHKYVDALNSLIKSDTHHKRLAQDTLVYWAEEGGEIEAEAFSLMVESKEDDARVLDALMASAAEGSFTQDIDLSRPFHVLCLSPNAGRISVRFYYSDNFGNIISRVAQHYKNLEIYSAPGKNPEKFPYIPPWMLLSETTVKKSSGDAAPLLAGQLLKSIVTGSRYPVTLYSAILIRIRAGEGINRTKAAIIKAVLQRNYASEVATVALNKDSTNIPYTLGRLFSVLEAAQASAGNKGLRERYFGGACTNPAGIFPYLLKLSMHHSAKSSSGPSYEWQKADLIGRLEDADSFPTALSLQEQGEFIVGYYHQRQEYFNKEDKNVKEDEIDE